ncbi:ArgE/DapE family deacylase [Clostridium sp. Cult2]|uniref:ArgE/DapE family deacylase n=1 Tax=Clostridium sp. Cult2 TaxID=2079003 RepID=UPI001F16C674|nr:ArgE/DapE family deacylase [Clostridium sp. Cult2]MCF6466169.1 succinyl-diaminopimelate desuccinylase [Clostridium sp. Cult2]
MKDYNEIKRAIDQAVESLEEELIEFAKEIVRIPTENPPGRYYPECAEAIGNMMEKIGCEVEYVNVPHELLPKLAPKGENLPRVNVIGKYKGTLERPNIHFSGHYDVVPAGDGWSVDPYEAVVKDGKLYGRGSSDQKSGIVSQIFAIYALKKAGIKLKGTIISSATPDEETGGEAGMGYLVREGYLSSKNTDYCVITECLDVDKVCLGHRGTLWFELITKGVQSHGSMPYEGVNAIENMVKVLNAIDKEIRPLLMSGSKYPIQPVECRKSTLTVTTIEAGNKVNTVPNHCKATFDWRLIPEQSVSWAKEMIVSICDKLKDENPNFDYEFNVIMEVEPTIVPDNTEVVNAFLSAGKEFLGKEMGFSLSPGSDDQKYVVKEGNMDQCIVYGPGPLVLAHKVDEYVEIEDMKNSAKIMALAATMLLGIEE